MKNLGSVLLAYMIGWGVFLVYFITVAQRTAALRRDLERLKESLRGDNEPMREPVIRGK